MTGLEFRSRAAKFALKRALRDLKSAVEEVYSAMEEEEDDADYGDDESEELSQTFHDACDELEVSLEVLCTKLAEGVEFEAEFYDLEDALEAMLPRSDGLVTKDHIATAASLEEALTLEAYGERHRGEFPGHFAVEEILSALQKVCTQAKVQGTP